VHRTSLLLDLRLKRIQSFVDAIQAMVDTVEPATHPIKPGFDMRQALAYIRELRRQPSQEGGANRANRNPIGLLDTLYRDPDLSLLKTRSTVAPLIRD
jgi:hypothetical protein